MKKLIRITALAVAIIIAAAMGVSCGVDYTDEEIKEKAESLIERSFDLNDIYFGKGLPVSEKDSDEAQKFAEENGFDLGNVQFLPVTDESAYSSIDEIKKATAKVYSESYCEYLFSMAFEGYSSEDGSLAVYARYMEDDSGTLTVRIDLHENDLPNRTYDYSSMKVKSRKDTSVVVTMDSYLDGKKEENPVSFTLVKDEKGWRLDTPTY